MKQKLVHAVNLLEGNFLEKRHWSWQGDPHKNSFHQISRDSIISPNDFSIRKFFSF